jgi:hypothetical protein
VDTSIPLSNKANVQLGDEAFGQYVFTKRSTVIGNEKILGTDFANNRTKLKLTNSGIVIKYSDLKTKKSHIIAKLNYRGGFPQNNKRKRWEIARDLGLLWTKFDKQDKARAWSKSQLLKICTAESEEDDIILQK